MWIESGKSCTFVETFRNMRVLIINTSEKTGGAAIAARRLMESLHTAGTDVKMLVLHKESQSEQVIPVGKDWQKKCTFLWERLVIWTNNLFSRKNLFTVSIANTGFNVTKLPAFREADIIHLHWINQGMLSLNNIQEIFESGKPVVWTLHDMWECTAICHHAHTCTLFKSECRNCRFLRFPGNNDLAHRVFKKKQKLFGHASPLNIVAVSTWLSSQIQQSTLLKEKPVSVIPNTLSPTDFRMMDKELSRKELSLPDKHIILFGAARIDDPIKGVEYLLQAIRLLIEKKQFPQEKLHLALFGKIKYPEKLLNSIPVSYTYLGRIGDTNKLSQLYSAADVTVSASFYETFGQTLIEAQACGCIPVSFGNSGQADIIRHKENGFLADYLSADSLAEGIRWGISEARTAISKENMRSEVFRKYSGEVVAKQYLNLYQNLIRRKVTQ